MICETKIGACSPTSQALINVYTSQYRLGRNGKRGGILTYAQVDISSKFITANFPNVEGFFLEINLREKNGLLLVHITRRTKHSSRIWKVWARLLTHPLQSMRTF